MEQGGTCEEIMSDIIETLGGEEIGQPASVKKVALASWIGTTIEWYDFYEGVS